VTEELPGPHAFAVVAVTMLIVLACILLHYEVFTLLTRVLARLHVRVRRRRILLLMFGLLALHVTEIWLFGLGYWSLTSASELSRVSGATAGQLADLVYFSAVVYSTLGLGDLVPAGAIRFMAGTESLAGFLLLTWSASFTFIEMQRFWKTD
jgi:hypothetical protein